MIYLVNTIERTITAVHEGDVLEIAGITREEFEIIYGSQPHKINGDMDSHFFFYTYEEAVSQFPYCAMEDKNLNTHSNATRVAESLESAVIGLGMKTTRSQKEGLIKVSIYTPSYEGDEVFELLGKIFFNGECESLAEKSYNGGSAYADIPVGSHACYYSVGGRRCFHVFLYEGKYSSERGVVIPKWIDGQKRGWVHPFDAQWDALPALA